MFLHKIVRLIQKMVYGLRMKRQGWNSYCTHGVPANWAYEHYAAVFQGGICPNCGKLNQGRFLGNVTGLYIIPPKGKPLSHFEELGWKIGSII